MILYTKYGLVEGTVDEIREFIQKENENELTNGCNEIEVGAKPFKPEKNERDAINRDYYDGTGKYSGGGTCWKGSNK